LEHDADKSQMGVRTRASAMITGQRHAVDHRRPVVRAAGGGGRAAGLECPSMDRRQVSIQLNPFASAIRACRRAAVSL